MIDLHIHLLPDLDDGPPDDAGALELARAGVAAGTTAVAATPHVDHRHGVDVESLPARFSALRELLSAHDVPLDVHQGAEISASRFGELTAAQTERLTLGSGRYLLIESPFMPAGDLLGAVMFQAQSRGYRVLLAHPERSPTFLGRVDRVEEFVGRGAAIQVTTGSMSGQFGRTVQDFTVELFERGLVHVVSSDAHDARLRPPGEGSAFAVLARRLPGVAEHRGFWTVDAPAAILAGELVPAPPAVRRGRRAIFRRRR